jgi:low affinity Fe/Cu permease
LGQSTGTTRLRGTSQERNLLVGLDSLEEGSLESIAAQTAGMSQEQEKTKSAVDATLEEIQKLHIIEQELAKAQVGTAETAH